MIVARLAALARHALLLHLNVSRATIGPALGRAIGGVAILFTGHARNRDRRAKGDSPIACSARQ